MDGYGRLGRRIEECFISPAAFLAYSYLPCILHHTLLTLKNTVLAFQYRDTHTLNSTLHMFFNMERLLREREMAFVKQLFWEVHFCNASMHCSLAATLFYLMKWFRCVYTWGLFERWAKGTRAVSCELCCEMKREKKMLFFCYAIYIQHYMILYARLSFLLQNARDMIMTLAI